MVENIFRVGRKRITVAQADGSVTTFVMGQHDELVLDQAGRIRPPRTDEQGLPRVKVK